MVTPTLDTNLPNLSKPFHLRTCDQCLSWPYIASYRYIGGANKYTKLSMLCTPTTPHFVMQSLMIGFYICI